MVLAGAVAAAWTEHIVHLREAGVADLLIVATEGRGIGSAPDLPTVVIEPPDGLTMMERIRFGVDALESPPDAVVDALDDFDPAGDAVVVGSFLNTAPELAGRPFFSYRRPEWLALEDKVVVDAFWDRAGVDHQPSVIVELGVASDAAVDIDQGAGTVWAADARDGFHGGATQTYWVADPASRDRAVDGLTPVCNHVRVMPFVDGIPCSIHGIVLPDGTAVLRPVEMVTLRRGRDFVYAGCATFWDPPDAVRHQMRDIARRVGAQLVAEVDFRGTFTVDGVAAPNGFWPTELNPRFGAGINTIARASGLPILMVNELIVGGQDIARSAADLEQELVAAADAHRGGGTWIHGLGAIEHVDARPVVVTEDGFRWAEPSEQPTGTFSAGDAFARCTYEPSAVEVGPSTAPLAVHFWAFADRQLGASLGTLTAAPDISPR